MVRTSNSSSSKKRKAASSSSSSSSNNNNNNNKKMLSSSSSRKSSSSSRSKSSSKINESSAAKLFDDIMADSEDPSIATMEGISSLCEKLHLDPLEDIRVLVLLWKLGANEKPAQITKDEWIKGCTKLQVDSVAKFNKVVLPTLDTGFLDPSEFKDFYKFCFNFNRQGTHKTLDKDLVVALLQLVLVDRIPSDRLETFVAFLEQLPSSSTTTSTTTNTYSRITLDQWSSFLEFCQECEDLSSYDEASSAWPVLIDEYVEYMEEQAKK